MIPLRVPAGAIRASWLRLPGAFFVLLLGAPEPCLNQEPPIDGTVEVGANVLVSGDRPELPHVEPHTAVNPQDPNHVVAASIVGGFTGVAVFVSRDGGETWQSVRAAGMHDLDGFGDPWLAFDPDGQVYLVGLDDPSNALVWRSDDGGHSWSAPTRVPGPEARPGTYDHPTIVVDRTSTESRGTVYVLGAVAVREAGDSLSLSAVALSPSSNAGASFEAPVVNLPTNLRHQAGTPAVLADGSVVFSLMDFSTERSSIRLLRTRRVWTIRTVDQGRTFSRPSFVAEITDFWAFPTLAADTSSVSPFADRMYVASFNGDAVDEKARSNAGWMSEFVLGTPVGVIVNSSDDRGGIWSHPRLVAAGMAEARHTTATVNRQGVVAIAWMQRTDEDDTCFEPFLAASLDGGETFLEPVRLADTAECPASDVPGNLHGEFDVAERWPAGGDYFGLVARPDGAFQAMWADSRTGVFQLWTATIRVHAAPGDP